MSAVHYVTPYLWDFCSCSAASLLINSPNSLIWDRSSGHKSTLASIIRESNDFVIAHILGGDIPPAV